MYGAIGCIHNEVCYVAAQIICMRVAMFVCIQVYTYELRCV